MWRVFSHRHSPPELSSSGDLLGGCLGNPGNDSLGGKLPKRGNLLDLFVLLVIFFTDWDSMGLIHHHQKPSAVDPLDDRK